MHVHWAGAAAGRATVATAAIVVLLIAFAAAPSTAGAVRFHVDFSGTYTQSWLTNPPYAECDIAGSGVQTIRFSGAQTMRIDFVAHRIDDRHPSTEGNLPSATTIERSDDSQVTPSSRPDYPCNPLSSTLCETKSVKLDSIGFTIWDRGARKLKLAFPHYVLEDAAQQFSPMGQCAGPAPDVVQMQTKEQIAWPGWERVFRPGSVTHLAVDHSWPTAHGVRDWFDRASVNNGGNSFLADVSTSWKYEITLRNMCRTEKVPRSLRHKLRKIMVRGRICRA